MSRVLLIDDDPLEAKLLAAFLHRRFGEAFRLVHVRLLEDGLALLEREAFDAVLLDNRLPPFSDFRETLPRLRAATRGVEPIIVSSSLRDPCFQRWGAIPEAPVVDKLHLGDAIEEGLLD